MTVEFGVAPRFADWYFDATVVRCGETDTVDGYTVGDKPTQDDVQDYMRCRHQWLAGMMFVDDEDVESVAEKRLVVCEQCDKSYADRDVLPLDIIKFEVTEIVR